MAKKPLRKSVRREVGADDIRPFSSYHDIAENMIDSGQAASEQDILDRGLLPETLFRWMTQGQIACIFAQSLATDPDSANWKTLTVNGKLDAREISDYLATEEVQGCQAIQLIFPGPNTAHQAANLVRELCADPRWSCYEMPWKDGEKGHCIPIGLRWQGSDTFVSWVLGIGGFEPMPFTRRFVGAPFLALVFRPSPPANRLHAPDQAFNLPASHLAHMDDGLGDDEVKRETRWEKTKQKKQALLGSDLRSIARAQVTFALPLWCRDIIAPVLKELPPKPEDAAGPAM